MKPVGCFLKYFRQAFTDRFRSTCGITGPGSPGERPYQTQIIRNFAPVRLIPFFARFVNAFSPMGGIAANEVACATSGQIA